MMMPHPPDALHDSSATCWREVFRCDDLRLARAVATSVAAMEFDVRLCSINPAAWTDDNDAVHERCQDRCDRGVPGPHVIEVPERDWMQLAGVIGEIIEEQQEFDASLELRQQRQRATLVLVLSAATAAHALVIWRILES